MTTNGHQPEATAVGRVASANERGIRFEGADEWSNFSRFAVGITPPKRGDVVAVTFDRQGFIRSVAPADGPCGARISSASQTTSEIDRAPKAAHDAPSGHHGRVEPGERDRTITRLAVLKAAAEFAATRSQLKSGDVLTIAASWERWVLRDDDADATIDLP